MRIALANVSSDTNKGACALTWASLDLVREAFPGASVAVVPIAETPPDPAPFRHTLSRYPDVAILPPLFDGAGHRPAVLLWRLARAVGQILRLDREGRNDDPTLDWIRTCDLVVSVGGVKFRTAAALRENPRLLIRALPLLAAQKIGVPTALVGAQFGPFETRFGRWLCRRIAANASAVFPRDRTSASELDPKTPAALLPDSALALTVSTDGVETLLQRRGLDASTPTLALVISRALRENERPEVHVAVFAHLARGLVESGIVRQVVVVLQTGEDREVSHELVRHLGLDPRFFIDDDLDPDQLSNLYRACRMVVSSRLHAVLLSLIAGVPAISLAPEVTFKERAVLELLGLEALWIPFTAGKDRILEKCLTVASEERAHRRAVANAVSAARAQWDKVPHELRGIVTATGQAG